MRKAILLCDTCCKEIKDDTFLQVGLYELCNACCIGFLERFLVKEFSKGVTVRSVCDNCNSSGLVRVEDKEATLAMATCGVKETKYKEVPCPKCISIQEKTDA